ncbi:MAG: hypothetical protein N3A54_01455 [Patescibacteria group bacterium]|nr:hypothetical protein [Patescibacteria group bacterium]
MSKDIRELLDNTVELPEALKQEIVNVFQETVKRELNEASFKWLKDIDVNKPLEYLASDPEFRRLVTAWDRSNPDITRAQLLRSFPAAFKDLQGNTIAEPLLSFFIDILNAIVKDPALLQRVIRQLNVKSDEGEKPEYLPAFEEGFKLLKIVAENQEEYMSKEQFVLDSGYKFAFFANDELMPVSPEEATHKVFVKTVTVSSDEEGGEKDKEEFSFVAKKLVALEWKPEFGGVGVDETSEKVEEPVETEPLPTADEMEEPETEEEDEEPLVDKLSEYLEFIAEQMIKENKIAIEKGIRVELAEKLINGIRNVLTENNIQISDKDIAALRLMEEKLAKTEDTLNSLYSKNIELFKKNKELQQQLFETRVNRIVDETLKGETLTESAQEKMRKMVKMINFSGSETDEDIKNKLIEMKEFIISSKEKVLTERSEKKDEKTDEKTAKIKDRVNKLFNLGSVKALDENETKTSLTDDIIIKMLNE